MMCFRDMTFCQFYEKCAAAEECGRAYTEEIREQVAMSGLPACLFVEKPGCFEGDEE